MRPVRSVTIAALVLTLAGAALAESRTVERTARAQAGRPVRIGVYINVLPDCTSGPLPTIRLTTPPAGGTVTVRKGTVSVTNYKQCLALQVPGFFAIYRSRIEFSGTDMLELEVSYPNGRVEIQKFQIAVGAAPSAQPI